MDKSDLILAAIEQMGRTLNAELTDIRAQMATMEARMATKDDLKELRVEVKDDLKELRAEVKEDFRELERQLTKRIETVDDHSESRFNSLVSSLIQLSKMEGRIEEQSKILQLALAGRMQRPPAAE
jgi:predicted nuclease with TOPRIM domain